jgi:hypothetical protein
MKAGDFTYIDPKGTTSKRIDITFKHWWFVKMLILMLVSKNLIFEFLSEFAKTKGLIQNWKIMEHDYTKQKDTHNCGVFVAQYLKKLVNYDLNLNIGNTQTSLIKTRLEMSNELKNYKND